MGSLDITFISSSHSTFLLDSLLYFINKNCARDETKKYFIELLPAPQCLFVCLLLCASCEVFDLCNMMCIIPMCIYTKIYIYRHTPQTHIPKYTLGNIICIHVSMHSVCEIALRDIDCSQSDWKGISFSTSTRTVGPTWISPTLAYHPLFPCSVGLH